MDCEFLIKPFDIALRFDVSTDTVINWARRGLIPGAVFVGPKVWFRPGIVEAFIAAGGTRSRILTSSPRRAA